MFKIKSNFYIKIEKGINIYDIEYLLLYDYNCYYHNNGDPIKETKFNISDISDGTFYFFVFKVKDTLYLSDQRFYYIPDSKYIELISSNIFLREYKIKKIKSLNR